MSWRSPATERAQLEERPDEPVPERFPEGMRDDFRDIARLAGYGADEIDDFIAGRTQPGYDEPETDEPSAWVSLEATRLECVTFLEARKALADVHEGSL